MSVYTTDLNPNPRSFLALWSVDTHRHRHTHYTPTTHTHTCATHAATTMIAVESDFSNLSLSLSLYLFYMFNLSVLFSLSLSLSFFLALISLSLPPLFCLNDEFPLKVKEETVIQWNISILSDDTQWQVITSRTALSGGVRAPMGCN